MEKILKREDGSKIKINVYISVDTFRVFKRISVYRCEPGKRTFKDVHDSDDYRWRSLNPEERDEAILSSQLEYVTKDEINSLIKEHLDDVYNKAKI